MKSCNFEESQMAEVEGYVEAGGRFSLGLMNKVKVSVAREFQRRGNVLGRGSKTLKHLPLTPFGDAATSQNLLLLIRHGCSTLG